MPPPPLLPVVWTQTQHAGLAAGEEEMVPGLIKLDPHGHTLLFPSVQV